MKRGFKEGDRVAVYHRHQRIVGVVDSVRDTGELRVIEDGFNSVHEESPFHPKQCRRLGLKNPRQEWWIPVTNDGIVITYSGQCLFKDRLTGYHNGRWIHVREIRKAVKK